MGDRGAKFKGRGVEWTATAVVGRAEAQRQKNSEEDRNSEENKSRGDKEVGAAV